MNGEMYPRNLSRRLSGPQSQSGLFRKAEKKTVISIRKYINIYNFASVCVLQDFYNMGSFHQNICVDWGVGWWDMVVG